MTPKVLVVEDDFDTLHPLSELLKLKGYAVYTAGDVDHGLRLAREKRPDLIIADIALPGTSGLGLISGVRADPTMETTPIVVISGCGPAMLVEAEFAGADFCLQKPIEMELFWQALGQITVALGFAPPARPEVIETEGSRNATEID
jgi:DNA-binding response OmpR family regulator